MFQNISNKLQENSLAHKAKSYWKNCKNWTFKDICPDRYNNQIKIAKEFYLPLLPKDALILDLGCADGWFSFEIAPSVYHIDAIDISENLIQTAQDTQKINNINNINFQVGEVDKVIDTNKLYDSVMCMGIFTCIVKDSEVTKIIQEFSSRIKLNGILFLKDSLSKTTRQYLDQDNYAAIYRYEDDYIKLFTNEGYELLHEGLLSDTISETGYFSGFKILKKVS